MFIPVSHKNSQQFDSFDDLVHISFVHISFVQIRFAQISRLGLNTT